MLPHPTSAPNSNRTIGCNSKARNGMPTTDHIIQDTAKGRGAGVSLSGVEDAGSKPYNAQRPQSQAIFRRMRKIAVSEKAATRRVLRSTLEKAVGVRIHFTGFDI